jgi:hypothetical protein
MLLNDSGQPIEQNDKPTILDGKGNKIEHLPGPCGYRAIEEGPHHSATVINPAEIRTDKVSVVTSDKTGPAPITDAKSFYNAETESLEAIRISIAGDESVPVAEKQFKIAALVRIRIQEFQDILFEARAKENEAQIRMNASNQYLIDLSARLTQAEREKLQLKDIQYKPAPYKPTGTKKTRLSPTEQIAVMLAKTLGIDIEVARKKAIESFTAGKRATLNQNLNPAGDNNKG